MENIVQFKSVAGDDQFEEDQKRDALRVLQGTIDLVNKGEVLNVALVMVNAKNETNSWWSIGGHRNSLIAGCEFLKAHLMAAQ
jgi:hypothetical protein